MRWLNSGRSRSKVKVGGGGMRSTERPSSWLCFTTVRSSELGCFVCVVVCHLSALVLLFFFYCKMHSVIIYHWFEVIVTARCELSVLRGLSRSFVAATFLTAVHVKDLRLRCQLPLVWSRSVLEIGCSSRYWFYYIRSLFFEDEHLNGFSQKWNESLRQKLMQIFVQLLFDGGWGRDWHYLPVTFSHN